MRKGFTIIELLVVVSIIGLLVAILLPAIGKARDSALLTQSQSNLRAIGQAAGIYGADFQDRQWTPVADDLGLPQYAGKCVNFSSKRCSAQLILGFDPVGTSVGFFIPQAQSCGVQATGASCAVEKAYWPCDFTSETGTGNFGSWRLVNAKSFNKYVSNRFYDPIFYAPKDKVTLGRASPFIETGADWAGIGSTQTPPLTSNIQDTVLSTYCWSPAAMWGPDVLSRKHGFQDPTKRPAGFRSPAASQAAFPDLKTRCLEHTWLQNKPQLDTMDKSKWQPGVPNPDSFCPATRVPSTGAGGMPWFFNQGYQSSPATVFFDGHIAQLGVAEAIDAYNRVVKNDPVTPDPNLPNEKQIKGTFAVPGDIITMPNAYRFGEFDNGAWNNNLYCSYHVLTADGILGRDTIGSK